MTISPTRAGMILGTAAYMAPEQVRGKPVDRRTDIWAFGAVLYEMLTGERAFAGETAADLIGAVLHKEPDFSRVPLQVRRLLTKCLEKDARQRLQAIGDWKLLLDDASATSRFSFAAFIPWAAVAVLVVALASVSFLHFHETSSQPHMVRFQIPPPEGATFGAFGVQFALSPDGNKLAFVASAKGGPYQVWIRSLDDLDAHPLPSADTRGSLFWSPDSRYVGFWGGGQLKKIEVSGGPPETLCNIPGNYGAHWNSDGFIYFATAGGIFRVPQTGGDPVPVVKAEAGERLSFPQVTPDGRRCLYLSNAGSGPVVYLTKLDGKEKKRLVATSAGARYAPPLGKERLGRILFLREGALMAQPIDPTNFELTGDAYMVAQGVGSAGTDPWFTISGNGALAYRTGTGANFNRQLTWFDRTGKVVETLGARGGYNDIALSRDGSRVAAVQAEISVSGYDVWLIDSALRIPSRFTFDSRDNRYPVWSPDDTRLAFSSNRDGHVGLYIRGANGAQPEERLQKSEIMEHPCDWSQDGRFLMYTRGSGSVAKLWVLSDPGDPDRRKAVPYLETEFNTTQCQFSPDSRWVAYTSDESKRGYEIYVQSFPVGAGKFQISSGGGRQPRWRRDGRELFYMADDGKLMAVDVKAAPQFQHGAPHALFDSHAFGPSQLSFRYDVTRDGQRFLVNTVPQAESGPPDTITVVLNWEEGLKK